MRHLRLLLTILALLLGSQRFLWAATNTFSGTGTASTAARWSLGSTPADGDTLVIAAGAACTWDLDLTAGATGNTVTINGALTVPNSLAAGAYGWKLLGNVTFGAAGTMQVGDSLVSPLPADRTFTLVSTGSTYVNCSGGPAGCLKLYCSNPAWMGVKIAAASIGDTTLTITGYRLSSTGALETGKDITTDTLWAATRGVRVDDVAGTLPDSEARTISSTTASTIVLTSGLTNAKSAGTWVWLTWRNIRLTGYTGTVGNIANGSGQEINAEIALGSTAGYGIGSGSSIPDITSAGGVIHGGARATNQMIGLRSTGSLVVTGCTNGHYLPQGVIASASHVVSGATYAIFSGSGCTFSGASLITGCAGGVRLTQLFTLSGNAVVTGCTAGIVDCSAAVVGDNSQITGCTTGIDGGSYALSGSSIVFTGSPVLSSNNWDIACSGYEYTTARGSGASLNSSTQVSGWLQDLDPNCPAQVCIYNIGGVSRTYPKAWMPGGRIVSDVTPGDMPTGTTITEVANFIYEQKSGRAAARYSPCWLDTPLDFKAGEYRTITCWLKKDTNSMTVTPRIQIIDPAAGFGSAGEVLASTTMADNTSWQRLRVSYKSTTTRSLAFRVTGTHSSGNLYAAWYR